MSLSSWLCSIIILHILQVHVKSVASHTYTSCLQITDKSICIKNEQDCNWNKYTSSCICNIDKNINLIVLLDNNNSDNNNNSYAYFSLIPSQKIIPYQNKHTKTAENNTIINFESAINIALSLFSSYTNTQNILVTSNNNNNKLSPSIQIKLNSLNIHTIFITETQNIFCEIQHYQQQISPTSRILLQTTNNKQTCCRCLKAQKTAGCPLDKDCEYLVCQDDQTCCKKSFIGWDQSCTETALSICNSPQTPQLQILKTLSTITPNVITPHVINPIPINLNSDFFYDTCWEIESDPPCNDAYYVNTLGCHWDVFDSQCMCAINNDFAVNIIYLIDISLSAMNTVSDFNNIAELISDVSVSTIGQNLNSHSQIILYDENVYIQDIDIDAIHIDISPIERTQNTDLLYAIDNALEQFNDELTPENKNILVIFNGEMQKDYHQDPARICPKKFELETLDVTVIVTTYTVNDVSGETARNLECLVSTNDAYNNIPFVAINGAVNEAWEGFPIEAKLSWDICHAASLTNLPQVGSHTTTLPVQQSTIDEPVQSTEIVIKSTNIPTLPVQQSTLDEPLETTEITNIPIPDNTVPQIPLAQSTIVAERPDNHALPAPTQPHLITTRPLCPQPQAICNNLQIFIVDICACLCIESSHLTCGEHERYDTNECACIRNDDLTPGPIVKCPQSVEICNELQIFDENTCSCTCRDLGAHGFRCDVNEIYDEDLCQCLHVNDVAANNNNDNNNDLPSEQFECKMKETNWNIEYVTTYKYTNTVRCYVYALVIDNKDSACGSVTNIEQFMIELPKCNNYNPEIGNELANRLVKNTAQNVNNIEIINSELIQTTGFGKIYSDSGNSIKIASRTWFTFCLDTNNKNLRMIDTYYNIYGENGYFAPDGETRIVDICSLIEPTNGININGGNRHNYYYYGGVNINMKQRGSSSYDSSDAWNK